MGSAVAAAHAVAASPQAMGEGPERAFIGLGANLGNPERQVADALIALAALPETSLLRASSPYRSTPIGPADQPEYLNAVALLATTLPPARLLSALQGIEQHAGRRRDLRWGPRTLDLDILLYGNRIITSRALTIPHPEIARRAFVLVPLIEIAGEALEIPALGRAGELLKGLPPGGVRRLDFPQPAPAGASTSTPHRL